MDNRVIVDSNQLNDLQFWKNALLLNTSIPAIIDDFDITLQRVSATPAIKAKYTAPDMSVSFIDYPKITNIPLAIQKGAGMSITYPIKKGGLCTLIFSQRSIDNLLLDGTKTAEPFMGENNFTSTLRCMDMTDAMCFPGIITNADPISNYNNDAVELRNADGTVKVSVSENNLTLQQDGASIILNGGNVEITGTSVKINGKDFDTHVHSGVTPGGANTGVVV